MMKSSNKKMGMWKFAISIVSTLLFLSTICLYQPARSQKKDQDQVFMQVDDVPTYPEGFEKLLGKELKYPESARKNKLEGKVLLSFIVEKDGSITSPEIKKGFNKDCDNEALRAFQAIGAKWNPGKNSGKPVRTQMVMPIQFKL